ARRTVSSVRCAAIEADLDPAEPGIDPSTREIPVEMVSELVPRAHVIGLLVNPNLPIAEGDIRSAQEAARAKGVQLQILKAGTESEIDAAFANLVQFHSGALVIATDAFFNSRREQLVALATRYAVPAIY